MAAVLACLLFLPEKIGDGIRNLPLLLAIIFLIVLYYTYKFFRLVVLTNKVKKQLRNSKITVEKTRFSFGKSYLSARSHKENYDICLLIRKKGYYHYYFSDENNIEFYKSSFAVSKSSRVTVAKGASYTRKVGKQKISRPRYGANNSVRYYLIIDKMPCKVTDSVKREELGNGDRIGSSQVAFYTMPAFIDHIGG